MTPLPPQGNKADSHEKSTPGTDLWPDLCRHIAVPIPDKAIPPAGAAAAGIRAGRGSSAIRGGDGGNHGGGGTQRQRRPFRSKRGAERCGYASATSFFQEIADGKQAGNAERDSHCDDTGALPRFRAARCPVITRDGGRGFVTPSSRYAAGNTAPDRVWARQPPKRNRT